MVILDHDHHNWSSLIIRTPLLHPWPGQLVKPHLAGSAMPRLGSLGPARRALGLAAITAAASCCCCYPAGPSIATAGLASAEPASAGAAAWLAAVAAAWRAGRPCWASAAVVVAVGRSSTSTVGRRRPLRRSPGRRQVAAGASGRRHPCTAWSCH